jgi:membrane associated rhomboid family serine protease
MDILNEIKLSFKKGSVITRLIYINSVIFIAVNLFYLFNYLFNNSENNIFIENWFAVPSSLINLLHKPWTVITYMFLHSGFFHLLFNMLWLYWFGQILIQFLDHKKIFNIYFLGGISGAVFYISSYNIFPVFKPVLSSSVALGASASIIAIVVATATYLPNYTVILFLIGQLRIKYIAIFMVLTDLLFIKDGNAGGHIAHLGGAVFGFIYGYYIKKGFDISQWLTKLIDFVSSLFKPRKRLKIKYKKPVTDYDYNRNKAKRQEEIDRILDKISKSGYNSLTKEEKELLFKAGNN